MLTVKDLLRLQRAPSGLTSAPVLRAVRAFSRFSLPAIVARSVVEDVVRQLRALAVDESGETWYLVTETDR